LIPRTSGLKTLKRGKWCAEKKKFIVTEVERTGGKFTWYIIEEGRGGRGTVAVEGACFQKDHSHLSKVKSSGDHGVLGRYRGTKWGGFQPSTDNNKQRDVIRKKDGQPAPEKGADHGNIWYRRRGEGKGKKGPFVIKRN